MSRQQTQQTEKTEAESLITLPEPTPMDKVLDDVLAERRRQIDQLGYTVTEDDKHDLGFFLDLVHGYEMQVHVRRHYNTPEQTRTSAVKLAAVCVALIERLDRFVRPSA